MDSEAGRVELLGVEPKPVWPIADIAAWLTAVADGRWSWTNNSQCKYVVLHIDTRRGAYQIEDRDNVKIEPFAVLRQGARQLDIGGPDNGLREALERIARGREDGRALLAYDAQNIAADALIAQPNTGERDDG
jgi:hypothetical protein